MSKRLTIEEVRNIIESNSKCILLSEEYIRSTEKLKLLCHCNSEFDIALDRIYSKVKNNKPIQCSKCSYDKMRLNTAHTYEYVKEYTASFGYQLLDLEYIDAHTKLNFICPNGHACSINFDKFKNSNCRCKKCRWVSIEDIQEFVKNSGFTLNHVDFEGSISKINFSCKHDHVNTVVYSTFKNNPICHKCSKEYKYLNDESVILEIRKRLYSWRKMSISECQGKCVITGEPFDDVHHLTPLNIMLDNYISNLSPHELSEYNSTNFVDSFSAYHDKHAKGVCLTKDVHKLLHFLFGVDCSEEDFYIFKENYIKGLYQDKINFLSCRNKIKDTGIMKGIGLKNNKEVTNQDVAVIIDNLLQFIGFV